MRPLARSFCVFVALAVFSGIADPFTPSVGAEERPAWVLFQVAERYFRERDFARAMEMYGEALARQPVYPEAMVGMARVHRAAGDLALARRYYTGALEQAHHLLVPDEEFAIRLELARLFSVSGTREDLARRREQLELVVARDPVFSRRENELHRDAMRDLLYRNGLDRVLVLYRLNFPQSQEAHRRLGELLLESGRQEDHDLAVEHFLFAVVEIAGRAVNALIDIQFDFEFTTVRNLLETARDHPDVGRYLDRVDFESALVGLADALDLASDPAGSARAEEIRLLVH